MRHRYIISMITLFISSISILRAEKTLVKRKRGSYRSLASNRFPCDRFIPVRGDEDVRSFLLRRSLDEGGQREESDYQKALEKAFPPQPTRVFSFESKPKYATLVFDRLIQMYTSPPARKKRKREFPVSPELILDAPELTPDSRLTLMDWSHENETIAVALYDSVYLWDARNGRITELCQLPSASITSVRWHPETFDYIAIGTSGAELQIWSVLEGRKLRTIRALNAKPVTTIAWCQASPAYLAIGDGDHVAIHDVRQAQSLVTSFSHESTICQLEWHRADGKLISGSQNGQIKIWHPLRGDQPIDLCQMPKAIRALALNPYNKTVLAVASGKTLSIWKNSISTRCLTQLTLPDDIVSIVWSTTSSELAVAFGKTIRVYRYSKDLRALTILTDINSHTLSILSLALSADGQTLVSEAEDETLKFWKMFPAKKNKMNVPSDKSRLWRLGSIR